MTEPAPGYRRVSFDHPPVNLMDARTAEELTSLVDGLESDDTVKVVVFDSANPEFFLARYDFSAGGLPSEPGPTGLPPFLDLTTRLSRLPIVSVAAIRGRARGGGSEFALACDLRFASDNAILGQPEVGTGLLPAGGGIERLTQLVGRSRALEIVLSADDFDAETAQRYGWITRVLPDAELDGFVDRLARRLAGFDRPVLAAAKRLVGRRTAPSADDLLETQAVVAELIRQPSFAARFAAVREAARAAGPDFELRLGRHL